MARMLPAPPLQEARAPRGMVVTSHPLAAQAGLHVLRTGGSAADAAVAAAAVLAVVEPAFGGLGGDAFALVRDGRSGRVEAINGAGRAPRLASRERFGDRIPERGLSAATVPAAVAVWQALLDRHGRRRMAAVLEPATGYAETGFPVSARLAEVVARNRQLLRRSPAAARVFLPEVGLPPGRLLRQPELAWSLRMLADGADAFYQGPVAARIERAMRDSDAPMRAADLAECHAEILPALSIPYRGWTVHEQPPPSQGFLLLEELAIVAGLDLARYGPGSVDLLHTMIEAKKLAFADRDAFAGDPEHAAWPLEEVLSPAHARTLRTRIDARRSLEKASASADRALDEIALDTSYLVAADADGTVVSLMQSIWLEFGCGVAVEGTGIFLNGRLAQFSLDPRGPNSLAPGRRPVHTLNSAILTDPAGAWIALGTPGGHTQVQTTFQVIVSRLDLGLGLAEAISAPRWASYQGADVELEEPLSDPGDGLRLRGHAVRIVPAWRGRGWVQAVERDGREGTFLGVSDPRWEGLAAGW